MQSWQDDAIRTLSDGSKVFAGQRGEGFALDLGSIFDLLTLRPFESLSAIPGPKIDYPHGVDTTVNLNVHAIALQVEKTLLTSDGSKPTNVLDQKSVIGVWAAASRQEVSVNNVDGSPPTIVRPLEAGI